ncbi:hypothetical protein ACE7GA_07050 [Roseomonas sp. CCTCC AB2023176]|uniref:hypothetical protein n=1 Tax=Roseomonas sp. CCTCC AB2023176 TaxID=3342640 RepID=UPI0035DE1DF6
MPPGVSAALFFALLCFTAAGATFLVFFGPGLAWRFRAWSWRGRMILAGWTVGLAAALLYFGMQLFR